MPATIVRRTDAAFVIQVEVPYKPSMLESEPAIQDAPDQAGVAATEEVLGRFDTDGPPLRIGPTKMTSLGEVPTPYQTPSGVAPVARHIDPGPPGGKTSCPRDQEARIVISPTPEFARMIACKDAAFGAGRVTEDRPENHGRRLARSFVPAVADAVAAVALAQEETWEYALPAPGEPVATITIGRDGTCMLMCEDGWREAMVGATGFSDKGGERLPTSDTAATPEDGKLTSLDRLDREIERVKAAYPEAWYVGLADGAKGNWISLELKAQGQVVDFYHVTPYQGSAAEVLFAASAAELRPRIDDWGHRLRHEIGAAEALMADLEPRGKALGRKRLPAEVEAALPPLRNQVEGGRMN